MLIGSDSPTLPGHLLDMASRALATHDVVLGPATDGGYYPIGLQTPRPGIFEGIDWSTGAVLEQTLTRCRDAGLRVFFLPTWYDIDTATDLTAARRDLDFAPGNRLAAARPRRADAMSRHARPLTPRTRWSRCSWARRCSCC